MYNGYLLLGRLLQGELWNSSGNNSIIGYIYPLEYQTDSIVLSLLIADLGGVPSHKVQYMQKGSRQQVPSGPKCPVQKVKGQISNV